ncbi:MAG: glycosyltransferase family 2 protein [Pseudomonadota bacterium]
MILKDKGFFHTLPENEVEVAAKRHCGLHDNVSAERGPALWQSLSVGFFAGLFIFGMWYASKETISVVGVILVCFYSVLTFLKLSIFCLDLLSPSKTISPQSLLSDDDLPIYSLIVPLYAEADVIPCLLKALEKIEYPRHKLDILFAIEDDDAETADALTLYKKQVQDLNISIISLPFLLPRTKPKALNAVLPYLKGKYAVIFDAEDRPDPLQLKKAASAFQRAPAHVTALQARLTFFNSARNLLTRMFTNEYDIWFHHYLPGLMRLGLPIPLAGTSTHFRVADLHHIGGWDAYNVTEDCDMGMRFAKNKLTVQMLDSDTYEEAPITLSVWIKQRTRWLKGYMQTQIVHSSNFWQDLLSFRPYQFIGFCVIVGGQVLSAFLHPFAIACFFYQFMHDHLMLEMLFMAQLKPLMVFLLFTGFLLPPLQSILIYSRLKRRRSLFILSFFHIPYWMLAAFACYRACWSLLSSPFHWEKTPHGIDNEEDEAE